jgi:hypothetical protein
VKLPPVGSKRVTKAAPLRLRCGLPTDARDDRCKSRVGAQIVQDRVVQMNCQLRILNSDGTL